jgi:hypothetical protein
LYRSGELQNLIQETQEYKIIGGGGVLQKTRNVQYEYTMAVMGKQCILEQALLLVNGSDQM